MGCGDPGQRWGWMLGAGSEEGPPAATLGWREAKLWRQNRQHRVRMCLWGKDGGECQQPSPRGGRGCEGRQGQSLSPGAGVGYGPGQSRNCTCWAWARALLGRPTGGRGRRPGSPEAPGLQGKGLGVQLRAPCEALGPELTRGEQGAEAALGAGMGSPARETDRASPSFSGEPCRPPGSVCALGEPRSLQVVASPGGGAGSSRGRSGPDPQRPFPGRCEHSDRPAGWGARSAGSAAGRRGRARPRHRPRPRAAFAPPAGRQSSSPRLRRAVLALLEARRGRAAMPLELAQAALYVVLELALAALAVAGNVLVCAAVGASSALQTPTNYFLVSLAAADVAVGLFAIPFAVTISLGFCTDFHSCLFLACFVLVVTQSSIFSLLAVAVDRYLAVRVPLR